MDTREKNPLMVPRGWMQAAAIVLIFGFFILGVLTYYTYNDEPLIPNVVKSASGSTLFTREDIMCTSPANPRCRWRWELFSPLRRSSL